MTKARSLNDQLRTRRRRQKASAFSGIALVVLAAVAWSAAPSVSRLLPWRDTAPGPEAAAATFADAWDDGRPWAGPVAGSTTDLRSWYVATTEGLDPAGLEVELVEVDQEDRGDRSPDADTGGAVVASFELRWALPGDHTWTYTTTATMLEDPVEGWQVAVDAGTVHPHLEEGARLSTRRLGAPRGDILGGDGTALVTERPVVHVGVQPSRTEDVAALAQQLEDLLEVDGDGLRDRVEAADEDAFVPVITLRDHDYDDLADRLHPMPGTVFQRDTQILAPTRTFARELLGRAGPVTAELLEEHPDRFQAGDTTGLSGLQRRFDAPLSGQAGFEVVAIPEAATDEPPVVLHQVAPEPGQDVQLTLDERMQRHADDVLSEVAYPSALVALRISDGHVLAVANGPGNEGREIALTGQFPPGSTFKVVTTAALLDAGLAPEETIDCPARFSVDGRPFRNAEDGVLGAVTFAESFAHSCNTAFVGVADRLDDTALHRAGRWFGIGGDHDLGVDAYAGQVPVNDGIVDQAAAMIGQGRNLVSPLGLADVAATVARGRHVAPTLVLDPSLDETPEAGPPLDDALVQDLRTLMRRVVTDGSGEALADVPGPPVHGKTGTAEYGDEQPPRTHAWFIGYQDDLAVAVLVAETENAFGGRVAAPIAAEFLTRVQG